MFTLDEKQHGIIDSVRTSLYWDHNLRQDNDFTIYCEGFDLIVNVNGKIIKTNYNNLRILTKKEKFCERIARLV